MEGHLFVPLFVIAADCICDLKKKEIFPIVTLVGTVAGILFRLIGKEISFVGLILALLPGLLVLIASVMTNGQIGKGDALALFLIGAWTDMWKVWEIILWSFFGTSICFLFLWVVRRQMKELPFVPFLFVAMVLSLFF